MVIQLPREIEERLNKLAEREGTSAVQLAVDAIDAMLERREGLDRWPPPKVVGLVEDDAGDAERRYGPRSNGQPWPKSVGMLADGGVPATEFDEWLEAERASDERLARKTSLRE